MKGYNSSGRSSSFRRLRFGWAVLFGAAFLVLAGSAAPAQTPLQRELRSALSSRPQSNATVGVCVIDLATGEVVFSENADAPLIPASAMKVFVMATALVELGPEFVFETVLATDGADLIVIGDGDPAIGDEKNHRTRKETIAADFQRWAELLVKEGVRTIAGDLVIDESIFDNQWVHASWEKSNLDNWYAAPVGGLNFNGNCVDITAMPAAQSGFPVLVSVQPETSLVKIVNRCRSGGDGKAILHHPYDTFEYVISGRCNKPWSFGSVSFPDPGMLFADSLRTVLKKNGIHLSGQVKRERRRLVDGSVPPSLVVLDRRRTPLADVLSRIGKDSQNLFAECLLKRCGYQWAKRHGAVNPQGSWRSGSNAVAQMVKTTGLDPSGLVVADGSGLSRDNACSARLFAQLLAWMHRQATGRLFYDNLSAVGIDGTMRKRLKDIPGLVYAKSGTMSGIRTLVGYAGGVGGPRYSFAIMFNGFRGPSTPYKKIQDRICRLLVNGE